jgi:uridine kinase
MAPRVPFLVGIAGGSGSGKTALAGALCEGLRPALAAPLAQDAYYRDRGALPAEARERLDFDALDAFDLDLFAEHLRALRLGCRVRPPRYCFVTHSRQGQGVPVGPADIVLVEGLFLLADPRARELLDLRIYLDAPERVRLARRLARDVRERGRTEQSILAQYRGSTFPAHRRWVEPSRAWADVVLVNAGRLEAVAEVAATIIRSHIGRNEAFPPNPPVSRFEQRRAIPPARTTA